nr:hypothetical protein Iba_scaffold38216CG0010 [Ipomoea batatas]GMD68931.1 hypothetical protein Iba_chr12dCG14020 [Ipomoea batatas]GME13792.1 hypothetical protein Iba_scaffold14692CG0010 [Ipomoea batatas]
MARVTVSFFPAKITGLTVSRNWTSSTILLVERRKGSLDRVSSRVICAICSSSFLLSHKNRATITTIPTILIAAFPAVSQISGAPSPP